MSKASPSPYQEQTICTTSTLGRTSWLTLRTTTTGFELTIYEPISSFLTDAHVYILAARYNHHAGAEAAAAATQARAEEILDCMTDTESTFDQHVALFHLESLIAAAQLASSCGVDWMTQRQPFTTTNTEGLGGGVVIGCGGGEAGSPMGLHAMVVAACVTLGPLLAELPTLRGAVFEDAGFAALWERVSSGSGGVVPGWFTPGVRERMRRVVEGREIQDSVWWCTS